jgi:AhpD family alkylhydroperoxidase
MMTTQYFKKRVFTLKSFLAAMGDIFTHLGDIPAASKSEVVNRRFAEKIMLAVTQVNGCRYCDYGHAITALRAGVTQEEIDAIRQGEFAECLEEEIPALLFAQHYAESQGVPSIQAQQEIEKRYGIDGTRDMLTWIKMISVGNLLGNTFDALISRLQGRPSMDSTLWDELAVLGISVLGSMLLTPIIFVVVLLKRIIPDRKAP